MKPSIFTTITLQDGSKCDILELTPWMIWKAAFNQQLNLEMKYDLVPFILEQILIIDGKKASIEFIGNINYQDYMQITEILTLFMTELENI